MSRLISVEILYIKQTPLMGCLMISSVISGGKYLVNICDSLISPSVMYMGDFYFFKSAFVSQELKKLGLGSEVDLHVLEVPVEYQTVQSLVPSLWKQYRPLVRQMIQSCHTETTASA